MTTTTTTLNDVDLGAVGALVEAIQDEPDKGNTTWKASITWDGAFRTTTTIRDFAPIVTDEPTGLGGGDTAPNPVEHLIGALGSCLAIGYAANATVAGIQIEDLRIEVEGELNLETFLGISEGNAGYETLRATVHIKTDADDAAVADLHNKVVSTSPVGHSLGRAVPLTIELA